MNRASLMLVALALAAGGDSAAAQAPARPCPDPEAWVQLTTDHLRRYPAMAIDDAYKLLFHATRGAEHAAPTAESARDWLRSELQAMGDGPTEPMVDRLGTGRFVRVHLRPFQSAGGDLDKLAGAFTATAQLSPAPGDLECALAGLQAAATEGRLPWSGTAVREYLAARQREGYPAVHHSAAFKAAYRPAYRVVAVELVPR